MSSNQVNHSHLTPLSFLARTVRVFPNKDALVYRQQRWTYAQFAARVNQLASALKIWGLRSGDRTKDIIISSGVNISTIEIERAIYQHPAVLEVAVIAIPDAKRGEVPKAFVTPKPDTQVTEAEIISFCRQNLA